MNKIYEPENQAQATYHQLSLIYHNAQAKDEYFDKSKYRWSLGVEVINDISNRLEFINAPDVPMELFGIPVGRDYVNPQKIELWKNITND